MSLAGCMWLAGHSLKTPGLDTLIQKFIQKQGTGEMERGYRDGRTCLWPFDLSLLTKIRSFSCGTGSYWARAIDVVLITYFPGVVQLAGNMLSHL